MAKKKQNKEVKQTPKKENLIKKDFDNGVKNLRYLANKYEVTINEVINQIK